jgi:hypothetical protein
MAVVERKEFKDYIGVYHCDTWELLRHFPTDTDDLYDLIWSPDSRALACYDNCLTYNIVVYTPDGRLLAKYQVLFISLMSCERTLSTISGWWVLGLRQCIGNQISEMVTIITIFSSGLI